MIWKENPTILWKHPFKKHPRKPRGLSFFSHREIPLVKRRQGHRSKASELLRCAETLWGVNLYGRGRGPHGPSTYTNDRFLGPPCTDNWCFGMFWLYNIIITGDKFPGNYITYPTKREVWKIIDSKCDFWWDMLVPWRVTVYNWWWKCPASFIWLVVEPPTHLKNLRTANWTSSLRGEKTKDVKPPAIFVISWTQATHCWG